MIDVEKETEQKIPKWEHDFWSYINRGNGVHCPLYSSCKVKMMGGWCPDEYSLYFMKMIQEGCSNLSDCYKFQNIICGRMFSYIDKLAQKYLAMGNVVCPPVSANVVSLADKNHHIEIRYLPLKNIHGALWYWDDEWIVQVNTNETLENRKFTLLHEAFHILKYFNRSSASFKMNTGKESFSELLAEQFAMCVLMPRKWINKVWLDTSSPMKIAKIFEVPEHLAVLRLSYLHLL